MEHACSTTSRPRKTSPSASGSVLPCSAVSTAASFFMSRRISSWSFSITRARAAIGVLRHVLNASAAAFTATPTSAASHIGTRARTSCVAGFTTSRQAFAFDSTNCPLMRSLTVGTVLGWGLAAMANLFGKTSIIARLSLPRVPETQVPRRLFRTPCDVDAGGHPQAARQQVAESDALHDLRAGVVERIASAPCASGTGEAEDDPTRCHVVARLRLEDSRVLVLVARRRNATHVDEWKLVERDVAARGAPIHPEGEHGAFDGLEVVEDVRAVGLERVVASDRRAREHRIER